MQLQRNLNCESICPSSVLTIELILHLQSWVMTTDCLESLFIQKQTPGLNNDCQSSTFMNFYVFPEAPQLIFRPLHCNRMNYD